jgi:uncharacterized repeat protein (TIGR03847 family)
MSTGRPRYNMGRVTWISAEAIGLPGERTFRLIALGNHMSAQLWLEKEQLQALAEAIARMLFEIDSERGLDLLGSKQAKDSPTPPNFPQAPDVDLEVGALGLRYDPQHDVIAIEASERDAEEGDPPAFRCLVTRDQMEALQAASIEVVAAGRPRCPLCGTPLMAPGMPHFCPPTNGHQKLVGDDDSG